MMSRDNAPVSQSDAALARQRWTDGDQPKTHLLVHSQRDVPDAVEQLVFLSDLHGLFQPLEAFEHELARLSQQRQLVFVGDHCHRGPHAPQVVAWLHQQVGPFAVMGNHDEDMFAEPVGDEPIYTAVGAFGFYPQHHREYVRGWPHRLALRWRGMTIVVWHGHINAKAELCPWLITPERQMSCFPEPEADLVVLGHSHYAYVRQQSNTTYANAGSMGWTVVGTMDEAGQVITQSGRPALGIEDDTRSSYLRVTADGGRLTVDIVRFSDDRQAALRDMEQAGLPNMERFRGWFQDGLMNRPTGPEGKLRWNR